MHALSLSLVFLFFLFACFNNIFRCVVFLDFSFSLRCRSVIFAFSRIKALLNWNLLNLLFFTVLEKTKFWNQYSKNVDLVFNLS